MAEVVNVVELSVVMHCEGCAGAVRKTIRRVPGVQIYTVDYTQQKALVTGTADPEAILAAIRKSGKMASLVVKGEAPAAAAAAAPAPAPAAPKAAPGQEEIRKVDAVKPKGGDKEESKEEKEEKKARFSFRSKMPKLPQRPKMAELRQRMAGLKMADLHKKMPDGLKGGATTGMVPKNFVTNACREFLTHGVFYAATDDISDSEDSVTVTTVADPVKA